MVKIKVQDRNKIQLGENKLELTTQMSGGENNMLW